MEKILVINPGSTSTKVAFYEGEQCKASENIKVDTDIVQKTDKIIEQERVARKYLGKNQIGLADKVYRAFGILENARILSSNECIDLLSDVKLGTDMGIISELDDTKIKKLFLYTKPANLQKYYGKVMDSNERDLKRTDIIRKIVTE